MPIRNQIIEGILKTEDGSALVVNNGVFSDLHGVIHAKANLVINQKLYSEDDVRNLMSRVWDEAIRIGYREGEKRGRLLD